MSNRIMVDMSVTLLHHGHIRLLRKAARYGEVVLALTTDDDIEKFKGFRPLLSWDFRKEIMESIKYVSEIVEAPYIITDTVLDKHNASFLVHGEDNFNTVSKDRCIIFPRTPSISSSKMLEYNKTIKICKIPAKINNVAHIRSQTLSQN